MIDTFIKNHSNQNLWHNHFRVLEALEGETIDKVIEYDDMSYLIIFKTGHGIHLFRNGAFSLLRADSVYQMIEAFNKETLYIAKSHEKIKGMLNKIRETQPPEVEEHETTEEEA